MLFCVCLKREQFENSQKLAIAVAYNDPTGVSETIIKEMIMVHWQKATPQNQAISFFHP